MFKSKLEEELYFKIKVHGLWHSLPEREYKFHPVRKWRFDFAYPIRQIAIEVEGGIFCGGRHGRGSGMMNDMEKYNTATIMGWRVLRFSDKDIKSGYAIEMIKQILR